MDWDKLKIFHTVAEAGSFTNASTIEEPKYLKQEEELIRKRIQEIKSGGGPTVVSTTPVNAWKFGAIAAEEGVDAFLIQSTVVSTKHKSKEGVTALDLEKFGAQGITVHPRPDERHIRYSDAIDLGKSVKKEFNIEKNIFIITSK